MPCSYRMKCKYFSLFTLGVNSGSEANVLLAVIYPCWLQQLMWLPVWGLIGVHVHIHLPCIPYTIKIWSGGSRNKCDPVLMSNLVVSLIFTSGGNVKSRNIQDIWIIRIVIFNTNFTHIHISSFLMCKICISDFVFRCCCLAKGTESIGVKVQ